MKHHDASHALLSEAHELGHEGRAGSDDHAALKLWLRMLATTTHVEAEIRTRLRERFDISLGRFDYLAQLFRHPQGLKMRTLSRYLMVTGGNVTGLTDELERDGLVAREASPDDRRRRHPRQACRRPGADPARTGRRLGASRRPCRRPPPG